MKKSVQYVLLYHDDEDFSAKVPLLPLCLGHEVNTDHRQYAWDNRFRRISNPICSFQYTISGEGFFENTEGVHRKVLPGDLLLLREPGNQRYCLPAHSDHWEVLFISFSGEEALRLTDHLSKKFGECVKLPEHSSFLKELWDFFHAGEIDEQIASDPYLASGLSYKLIMSLFSDLEYKQTPENLSPSLPVNRVCSYCRWHVSKKITVSDMAHLAKMSRSHFTRVFKTVKGVSPMDFLFRLKMEHAASLLASSVPTKSVAENCGFENQSHFCKCFRKFYGINTGEYRKRKLSASPGKTHPLPDKT